MTSVLLTPFSQASLGWLTLMSWAATVSGALWQGSHAKGLRIISTWQPLRNSGHQCKNLQGTDSSQQPMSERGIRFTPLLNLEMTSALADSLIIAWELPRARGPIEVTLGPDPQTLWNNKCYCTKPLYFGVIWYAVILTTIMFPSLEVHWFKVQCVGLLERFTPCSKNCAEKSNGRETASIFHIWFSSLSCGEYNPCVLIHPGSRWRMVLIRCAWQRHPVWLLKHAQYKEIPSRSYSLLVSWVGAEDQREDVKEDLKDSELAEEIWFQVTTWRSVS